MKITIAICTYNNASSLRETLRTLANLELPDQTNCELLVVDNGSTDDTQSAVVSDAPAALSPVYLRESRKGQSFARNTALAAAKGDIIVFTDDDVRPPPSWLRGLCRPIVAGTHDAVAGAVKLAPHLKRPWMSWLHRAWLASTEDTNPAGDFHLVGANMAFSREVLEKVPAFDVELGPGALGFHDDSLFSAQLREAGYRLGWAHAAVEHHCNPMRLQRANFVETARKMGASSAYWSHHWEHAEFARPRATAALWRARLLRWRLVKPKWNYAEGMPEWEMWMLWQYYKYRYFLRERRRPRNYLRRGLIKIGGLDGRGPELRHLSQPLARELS